LHQGAKALVLQADKKYILLVVPGDMRADLESLKTHLQVRRLAMASKDSVKEKTGLEVGAVPPFGSTIGLTTYIDPRMADNTEIVFNAGRHDRSIKMKYLDFMAVEKPVVLPAVK
jgi:Ala-tRNA(Pro) deacylase